MENSYIAIINPSYAMRPLAPNDIESELCYAYLHAIASKAGASCSWSTRHEDNSGIDATITAWSPFPNGGYLREITLNLQLKSTIKLPSEKAGYLSYWLEGVKRYDDLRADTVSVPRILVVLFLPESANDWITISHEELTLKKCAYWVSLRGAAESLNGSGETIYLPKAQIFTPENLTDVFSMLSRKEVLNYWQP